MTTATNGTFDLITVGNKIHNLDIRVDEMEHKEAEMFATIAQLLDYIDKLSRSPDVVRPRQTQLDPHDSLIRENIALAGKIARLEADLFKLKQELGGAEHAKQTYADLAANLREQFDAEREQNAQLTAELDGAKRALDEERSNHTEETARLTYRAMGLEHACDSYADLAASLREQNELLDRTNQQLIAANTALAQDVATAQQKTDVFVERAISLQDQIDDLTAATAQIDALATDIRNLDKQNRKLFERVADSATRKDLRHIGERFRDLDFSVAEMRAQFARGLRREFRDNPDGDGDPVDKPIDSPGARMALPIEPTDCPDDVWRDMGVGD